MSSLKKIKIPVTNISKFERDILNKTLAFGVPNSGLFYHLYFYAGDKGMASWFLRQIVEPKNVLESFKRLQELYNRPDYYFKNTFYSRWYRMDFEQLAETKPGFLFVYSRLKRVYPYPELWYTLLPYVYNAAKNICIESMLLEKNANGTPKHRLVDITKNLATTKTQVYRVKMAISKCTDELPL